MEQMQPQLTETIEQLTSFLSFQISLRVEEVAKQYVAIIAEKDREIEGLRGALKQSAKDFNTASLNTLVKEAHETAKEKGWWDQQRSSLEIHMLLVSEIAEATECVRKDVEGEKEELADCVIRIMDYFGAKKWDLGAEIKTKMEYNKTRDYRHGGKKF